MPVQVAPRLGVLSTPCPRLRSSRRKAPRTPRLAPSKLVATAMMALAFHVIHHVQLGRTSRKNTPRHDQRMSTPAKASSRSITPRRSATGLRRHGIASICSTLRQPVHALCAACRGPRSPCSNPTCWWPRTCGIKRARRGDRLGGISIDCASVRPSGSRHRRIQPAAHHVQRACNPMSKWPCHATGYARHRCGRDSRAFRSVALRGCSRSSDGPRSRAPSACCRPGRCSNALPPPVPRWAQALRHCHPPGRIPVQRRERNPAAPRSCRPHMLKCEDLPCPYGSSRECLASRRIPRTPNVARAPESAYSTTACPAPGLPIARADARHPPNCSRVSGRFEAPLSSTMVIEAGVSNAGTACRRALPPPRPASSRWRPHLRPPAAMSTPRLTSARALGNLHLAPPFAGVDREPAARRPGDASEAASSHVDARKEQERMSFIAR